MKIVKFKEDYMEFKKGTQFIVDNEDDGFYTDYAFYQGWMTDKTGHKSYRGIEKKYCEVVDHGE